MQTEMRVLYDGWPLVYQQASNASLHLWELLAGLPVEVQPVLALPCSAPDWLPSGMQTRLIETANTAAARLHWEQRRLPQLARQAQADLLHLTHLNAPISSLVPLVISPTAFGGEPPERVGLWPRLRAALAAGVLARPLTLLWPEDLPAPDNLPNPTRLPLMTCRSASALSQGTLELPESYVLYHGPTNRQALLQLIDVWSWASHALGEDHPLLLVGLSSPQRAWLEAWLTQHDLRVKLTTIDHPTPDRVLRVYQHASALLHPTELAPWGDPVQRALGFGKAVVAVETTWADARVGPAGYLAPVNDPRSLGAALISVIVEAELASSLTQAARQRAQHWSQAAFSAALRQAYQRAIG